jgi:hypothetical protein
VGKGVCHDHGLMIDGNMSDERTGYFFVVMIWVYFFSFWCWVLGVLRPESFLVLSLTLMEEGQEITCMIAPGSGWLHLSTALGSCTKCGLQWDHGYGHGNGRTQLRASSPS